MSKQMLWTPTHPLEDWLIHFHMWHKLLLMQLSV